jgi:hypothetical protein
VTSQAPNPDLIREPGPAFGGVSWARLLAVCAAAGTFMALVGAFSTGAEPIGRRLAYWIGLLLVGGLAGGAIARRVFGSGRFQERPWLAGAIVAALLTLPLTLLVWAASTILFRSGWDPAEILRTLPSVAVVSAAMTAIAYLVGRAQRQTRAEPAAPPPPFLKRLPPKLRGARIYAVEAEDHYLRVHTDRGSDLILMRLSEAIGELEGLDGAQTHRSWWVAREAVADVERGDGRATLTLGNGVKAPVSRTHARTLREAGWY